MRSRTEAVSALRPAKGFGRFLACVGMLATAGCVTTGSPAPDVKKPPTGAVCQVVATWNNQVSFTPDPTHGGTPTPGLVGRVYLFGPNIDFPLAGDGSLVVDLYEDETNNTAPASASPAPAAAGQPTPRLVEEWRIDKATMARLLRRDAIGWGYTLFLPWGTYRPDVTHIQLKARYEPTTGTPLYADAAPLTLNKGDVTGPIMQASHQAPGR